MKRLLRCLRPLHRYVGLSLALFLLVLATTGGVLVFESDLWRLQHPALREPLRNLTAADHAAAIRSIEADIPGAIRKITFPQPELAAYRVRFDGGEAFVHQSTHDVLARWRWYETPLALLRELHVNLAAGRLGHQLAGVIALLAVAMLLTGLWLWWPLRRRYRPMHLVPRKTDRQSLLSLHRDLGVTATPLILLLVLTGAGLVFYSTTRQILNTGFSERPVNEPRISASGGGTVDSPSEAIIAAARKALPAARIISYQPPAEGSTAHHFRLRQPGERHPNGRSAVYVDHLSHEVLAVVDATGQPRGERLAHLLYPLHAGRIGGRVYQLVVLVGALALALMTASGVSTWWQARRRYGRFL